MKQLICIEGKLNEGMLAVIGCEESYNKYCQKGEAEDEGGTGSTRMVFCFLFFFYVQVAVAVSHSDPLLGENVCIPT